VSSTSDTDQGPGPQFSPDGQKLAYMSDRSGTMEIWIANRDGSNAFLLTAVGGAGTPRWSPDSKAIAFDVGSTTGEKNRTDELAWWRTADIGGRRLPQLFARRQMGLLCCQPQREAGKSGRSRPLAARPSRSRNMEDTLRSNHSTESSSFMRRTHWRSPKSGVSRSMVV
jgi:dipeptidyl aminopeptidase/acylaminoacyl peptidase